MINISLMVIQEKKIDKEYNSSNTKILDKEELIKILLELPEVQSQL